MIIWIIFIILFITAFILYIFINTNTNTNKNPSKTVIVIGSGMAGMTSAELLLNNGYSVTILEANDRIGGRTYTNNNIFSYNGQFVPIDVGASWIHGDQNQPLIYLKNKGNIVYTRGRLFF